MTASIKGSQEGFLFSFLFFSLEPCLEIRQGFFMDIFKIYENLEQLKPSRFLEIIGELVIDADDFILFMQQEQLLEGKNEDNEVIGRYSEFTQDIATYYQEYDVVKPLESKIAGEPYNFRWSGKYFKGMYIKVYSDSKFLIEIDSTAPYALELEKRYKKLLGLVDKNQNKLNSYVEIEIAKIINKFIGNV